jgi:hypothetical protein
MQTAIEEAIEYTKSLKELMTDSISNKNEFARSARATCELIISDLVKLRLRKEKDQIKEAFIAASPLDKTFAENLAEQYYNETFKPL